MRIFNPDLVDPCADVAVRPSQETTAVDRVRVVQEMVLKLGTGEPFPVQAQGKIPVVIAGREWLQVAFRRASSGFHSVLLNNRLVWESDPVRQLALHVLSARQAVQVLLDRLLLHPCTCLSAYGMDTPRVRLWDVPQVCQWAVPAVGTGVVVEYGDDEVFHVNLVPLAVSAPVSEVQKGRLESLYVIVAINFVSLSLQPFSDFVHCFVNCTFFAVVIVAIDPVRTRHLQIHCTPPVVQVNSLGKDFTTRPLQRTHVV